jgi:ferredoxin
MLRAHIWEVCQPDVFMWQAKVYDESRLSIHIKEIAKYLGADLVGITKLYDAFVFADDREGAPLDLSSYTYAIVLAKAMDYDRVRTGPSWMDHVEEGLRYQDLAVISTHLATYIAQLGYRALASCAGNDVVLHTPLAVYAGLGELSRMGILVTKNHGPRIRLASVLTDLPLSVDHPIDLNVGHFCEVCRKCTVNCRSGAIPLGEKTETHGVLKWKLDEVKCYRYFRKDPINWQACIRCIAVCPWSKPSTWPHRLMARAVAKCPSTHRFFRLVDDLVYGKKPRQIAQPSTFNDFRMKEEEYWQMLKDPAINIKSLSRGRK